MNKYVCIIFLLILFEPSCTSSSILRNNQNEDPTREPAIPMNKFQREQSKRLIELSERFELANLRSKKLSEGSTELRIWGDLPETHLTCLVIEKTSKSIGAKLIRAPLIEWKMIEKSGGGFQLEETKLNLTKEEQEKAKKILERFDMHSPLKLLSETQLEPYSPDDMILIVELNDSGNYSLASYWKSNVTPDAKKVNSFCKEFERLTASQLGCRFD